MTLQIVQDETADAVLSTHPFALVIGMLLAQDVPVDVAFAGPAKILQRFGSLDPAAISEAPPDDFAALCATDPPVHSYPDSMAVLVQAVASYVVVNYGGDAASMWETAGSGEHLLSRLVLLPGFTKRRAQMFVALLGKQLGVRPEGWQRAAGPYAQPEVFRSVADVRDPESLEKVRLAKNAKWKSSDDAGDDQAADDNGPNREDKDPNTVTTVDDQEPSQGQGGSAERGGRTDEQRAERRAAKKAERQAARQSAATDEEPAGRGGRGRGAKATAAGGRRRQADVEPEAEGRGGRGGKGAGKGAAKGAGKGAAKAGGGRGAGKRAAAAEGRGAGKAAAAGGRGGGQGNRRAVAEDEEQATRGGRGGGGGGRAAKAAARQADEGGGRGAKKAARARRAEAAAEEPRGPRGQRGAGRQGQAGGEGPQGGARGGQGRGGRGRNREASEPDQADVTTPEASTDASLAHPGEQSDHAGEQSTGDQSTSSEGGEQGGSDGQSGDGSDQQH